MPTFDGHASIHLPHNAKLISARFDLSDFGSAENLEISIWRAPLGGGSRTVLAEAITSGSGGDQVLTRMIDTTIDNQNQRYFVYVETDEPQIGAQRVNSVQLQYTVDSTLP